MTKNGTNDLATSLRSKGLRKKLATDIGQLEGNKRRGGAGGEARARRAIKDLEAAVDEIRERALATDPKRRAAAKKAAQTRKRKAAQRRTSAKRGASTRAKVARARSSRSK